VLPGLFFAPVVIAETVLKPQMFVDCVSVIVWSADHRTFLPCVALIEKPPLSRNSSGTGSPRKSKIKGLSLPDPGNKPLKAGGSGSASPILHHWLGKTIFGSFRVGFEDGGSRDELGENEALLHAQRAAGAGGDHSVGGGNLSDGSYSPGGILKHSGSGIRLPPAGPAGLPRPHHTGTVPVCAWADTGSAVLSRNAAVGVFSCCVRCKLKHMWSVGRCQTMLSLR
jgi:hypothetical protein